MPKTVPPADSTLGPDWFRGATGPGTDPGSSIARRGVQPSSGVCYTRTLRELLEAAETPRRRIYIIWRGEPGEGRPLYIGVADKETVKDRFQHHLSNNPKERRHRFARYIRSHWKEWPDWTIQAYGPNTLAAKIGHTGKMTLYSVERAAQRELRPRCYGAASDTDEDYNQPLPEFRRSRI